MGAPGWLASISTQGIISHLHTTPFPFGSARILPSLPRQLMMHSTPRPDFSEWGWFSDQHRKLQGAHVVFRDGGEGQSTGT